MLGRKLFFLLLLFSCALLSGCYTTPATTADPHDPFDHFNRDTTRMNTKLDNVLVKPIAKEYETLVPYFVRKGVGNFFDNLDKPEQFMNDLLQGHGQWAMNDAWSFVVNTTVGIGGFFTPSTAIGLQPHENDFGLTLNQWHLYTAYFVLPIVGPRTIGSSLAIPVDYYLGVTQFFVPLRYSIILNMIYGINARANLLNTERTAGGLIFDRYIFYRSAYLQRRAYLEKLNQQQPYYSFEDADSDQDADANQAVDTEELPSPDENP